ncbi:MAG: cupin domain-containing protein [Planctomycetota bacterium]
MTRIAKQNGGDTGLGLRLRALRESRGLSLRALARLAGITPGTLSQMENGKSTSLGEFFSMEEAGTPAGGFVFRSRELVDIASGRGLRFLTIPGPSKDRALQCLHETYAPGADTGPKPYRHAGEETGFCLSGSIELTVDGRRELLGPGDGYYYSSDKPHRWRNVGNSPAEVISTCTPPSF